MYLFEAIRLGAMSKPQGFGTRSANIENDTLCAVGAAKFAVGCKERYFSGIYSIFPVVYGLAENLATGEKSASILDCIWWLNDSLKWTREQIAQWLEPIELAYYKAHPEDRPVDVVVEEKVMETLETVHV